MPFRRVIASLLLRKNRLVKGVQFSAYRDAGDPRATVRMLAAQGIDPSENTPEEFAKQIEGDVAIFRKLVDDKVVVLEPAEPAKP